LALPKEFGAVLATVCMDRAFVDAYPQCAAVAFDCLREIDAESTAIFDQLDGICRSLVSTCQFLSKFNDMVS
jgi:hypothetical protein